MKPTSDASVIRHALRRLHLPFLAEDPELRPLVGGRGGARAKAVIMALWDATPYRTHEGVYEVEVSIAKLAAGTGWSPRSVTRSLVGAERLGLIKRAAQGPHPWRVSWQLELPQELGFEHQARLATDLAEAKRERLRRWRERKAGQALESASGPGTTPCKPPTDRATTPCKPPTDRATTPCKQSTDRATTPCKPPTDRATTPCKRPTHRATTPCKQHTDRETAPCKPPAHKPPPSRPALISALWNLCPDRVATAQEARGYTWKAEVSDVPPEDLWHDMAIFCQAMSQGQPRKYAPGPTTLKGFEFHLWALEQVRTHPEMAVPHLGRDRASGPVVPMPYPTREQLQERINRYLQPEVGEVLAELTHGADDLYRMVRELLLQADIPPPDWLTDRLRARWGRLPLFR